MSFETAVSLQNPGIHPSEEHELVASSTTRTIIDQQGRAAGQTPRVLPGSLEERELIARIDQRRHDERPEPVETRRRRLRRYWAQRARHEA